MPKYRVTLDDYDNCEIEGILVHLTSGDLAFADLSGAIIRVIARGNWLEVTRIAA